VTLVPTPESIVTPDNSLIFEIGRSEVDISTISEVKCDGNCGQNTSEHLGADLPFRYQGDPRLIVRCDLSVRHE
jgi:hypothetical protein